MVVGESRYGRGVHRVGSQKIHQPLYVSWEEETTFGRDGSGMSRPYPLGRDLKVPKRCTTNRDLSLEWYPKHD